VLLAGAAEFAGVEGLADVVKDDPGPDEGTIHRDAEGAQRLQQLLARLPDEFHMTDESGGGAHRQEETEGLVARRDLRGSASPGGVLASMPLRPQLLAAAPPGSASKAWFSARGVFLAVAWGISDLNAQNTDA
jgi:hypothetical protein